MRRRLFNPLKRGEIRMPVDELTVFDGEEDCAHPS